MKHSICEPCTIADLCEIILRATPEQMAMYRAQLAAGRSFAVRNGLGEAVCGGGYVPLANGTIEAWLVVNPETGPKAMLAVVRAIALTLRQTGYLRVQARAGTEAGKRILLAAGFAPEPATGEAEDEHDYKVAWRR